VPIRAILFDLDNTLILEDQATERALRETSELANRRAGADPTTIVAAARDAARRLFETSAVFEYADAMGIWWGEALWGRSSADSAKRSGHARCQPQRWTMSRSSTSS
jgi:FMN phosphatase YigB (HAD superfamily)